MHRTEAQAKPFSGGTHRPDRRDRQRELGLYAADPDKKSGFSSLVLEDVLQT